MPDSTASSPHADKNMNMPVDPTKNVLDLVQAAVTRLDDISELRTKYSESMRAAADKRLDDLASLHAFYQEKLSSAEAKRLDAVRGVDMNAIATANEKANQQALVLANQLVQSTDMMRALIAATADTLQKQQQSLQSQVTERLSLLERNQYEAKGKEAYADPMMTELVREVKALAVQQNTSTGKGEGFSTSWGIVIAVIAAGVAVGSLVLGNRKTTEIAVPIAAVAAPAQSTQPPIIYITPTPQAPQPQAPVVIQPGK